MSSKLRSEENKEKALKTKKAKFSWKNCEQILKDVVKKGSYFKPSPEDLVKIATELSGTYKVEGVTAGNVRWKMRTPKFRSWLKKEKGKKSHSKKRKRSASSTSSPSSDSSYSSEDTTTSSSEDSPDIECQNFNSQLPRSVDKGFALQPVFWTISDSNYWWYFMRRKWKIEAQHVSGRQYLEIEYKIDPPNVFELQALLKKSKQESLKSLDIKNPNIQNQIKDWKPITWKVALSTPLPLVPSLYRAAREDEYSWIQVPRNNPKRSTAFGDEEMDVDYFIPPDAEKENG